MAKLIECVPNFSLSKEKDEAGYNALVEVANSVPGVTLFDAQTDGNHNRSVFTLVGGPAGIEEVAFQLTKKAAELIDMNKHVGEHSRMGATDVIPFIPTMILERCHSYKDKMAHGFEATHGLFAYPVLMAADILIMQSDLVPVGKDQKQHLEVTRDLCQKFNNAYGEIFKMPDAYIPETVATIPGTDGQKMSKSHHNTIELFDVSAKKKIMGIVTDSTPMEEPKEPEGNSIYEMYKLFATPEEVAEMAAAFRAGGYGYGTAKKALLQAYHRLFDPFKEKRDELAKDPDALEDILKAGAARARAAAAPLMEKVRKAVGL